MPPLDEVAVVDAETGREVRRFKGLIADGWWWEYPNFAWDADGQLLVLNLDPDGFRYRRIDVTTGAEADVTLPQNGFIETSPDGTATLVTTGDPDAWRVWILDDRFEHTRLLWKGEQQWAAGTWSPDGTRFAGQTRSEAPPPKNMAYDLQVIDITTGTVTTHVDDDAVGGQPLWLPAD
jgi:Tol biopolymer transport system component